VVKSLRSHLAFESDERLKQSVQPNGRCVMKYINRCVFSNAVVAAKKMYVIRTYSMEKILKKFFLYYIQELC
jgi:hypothetical protein